MTTIQTAEKRLERAKQVLREYTPDTDSLGPCLSVWTVQDFVIVQDEQCRWIQHREEYSEVLEETVKAILEGEYDGLSDEAYEFDSAVYGDICSMYSCIYSTTGEGDLADLWSAIKEYPKEAISAICEGLGVDPDLMPSL